MEGPTAPGRKTIIRRFAVVTEATQTSTGLRVVNTPEYENPKPAECPPGLLRLLEGYPPRNPLSLQWRERAQATYRDNNRKAALFRKLRYHMKHATPKVVLDTGRIVDYALLERNGRQVSAYRNDVDGSIYQLPHDIVNLEATLELLNATKTRQPEGEPSNG